MDGGIKRWAWPWAGRIVSLAAAALTATVIGPVSGVQADEPVDASLLCLNAPDPAGCAQAEWRVWTAAAGYAATLDQDQIVDFCGSGGCTLRGSVTAALAGPNRGGVSCVLGASCDLFPVLGRILDLGEAARADGAGVEDHYLMVRAVVDRALTGGMPSDQELYLIIAFLSGGPGQSIAPSWVEAAASGNASAGTAVYDTGEVVTAPGPADALVPKIPAGCTASFTFGRPFFFKHKPVLQFYVDFHYGQHLDSFAIVDRRVGGPNAPCPPTSASIDMGVRAHYKATFLDPPREMNAREYGVPPVTARWDRPYLNCYDPSRCLIVLIETDDRRPSVDCCLGWPVPGRPFFWHVGEYHVRLNHEWQLSHGYDSEIYTSNVEDGYINNSYNQHCRWGSASFDPHVPEACEGDG